ncbi:MIR motif [Pseudocohnilembus persalinus]|uniref:MIR motif n=1 Tax=Pseudocohnilembus persalinus TaxID=266149 RepID=A0A0V0QX12_PSEPJ|nr:MIR motif [Pseudocohnilembus persalinus]|eukprot:KRX06931.1 MIR motif [Pseudocohnilembus persalinus]
MQQMQFQKRNNEGEEEDEADQQQNEMIDEQQNQKQIEQDLLNKKQSSLYKIKKTKSPEFNSHQNMKQILNQQHQKQYSQNTGIFGEKQNVLSMDEKSQYDQPYKQQIGPPRRTIKQIQKQRMLQSKFQEDNLAVEKQERQRQASEIYPTNLNTEYQYKVYHPNQDQNDMENQKINDMNQTSPFKKKKIQQIQNIDNLQQQQQQQKSRINLEEIIKQEINKIKVQEEGKNKVVQKFLQQQQAPKPEKIKFGDTIILKLASDQFFFSTPGFTTQDLQLKKIQNLKNEMITQCLFRIIPPLQYDALRKCQQKKQHTQEEKEKLLEDLAVELIEQENLINLSNGVELTYSQDFQLQHIISKKILSFRKINSEYYMTLEQIPQIDFNFNLLQFFKFRHNKENQVSYNEKLLLIFQASADNQQYNFAISENSVSDLYIQKYEGAENFGSFKGKIKAGDIVSINNLQSLCNISLQIDIKHYNNKVTNNVFLEYPDENQILDMNSLWVIEKQINTQGGPISWYEEFRLRNIQNGKYLSFDQSVTQTNEINPLLSSYEQDNSTLFFLEDEKGILVSHESQVDYNETFSISKRLKNEDQYTFTIAQYFDNKRSKFRPQMKFNAFEVESFKFVKLLELNAWEIRFIKDIQGYLLEQNEHFTKVLSELQSQKKLQIYNITEKCIDETLKSIQDLKNFLFTEGYYSNVIFQINSPNKRRQAFLIKSKIHEILFTLLEIIIPNSQCLQILTNIKNGSQNVVNIQEDNQTLAQNKAKNKNKHVVLENILSPKNSQQLPLINESKKNLLSNSLGSKRNSGKSDLLKSAQDNLSLVRKLNIQQKHKDDLIADKLFHLVEAIYNTLSFLVPSSIFPEFLIKPYSNLIISHIGQNLKIWNCLSYLLSRIKDISLEISPEQKSIVTQEEMFKPEANITYLHLVFAYYKREFGKIKKPKFQFLDFLASICIKENSLNRQHQTLIGEVIFDKYFYNSQEYQKIFLSYQTAPKFLYVDVYPYCHQIVWETKYQQEIVAESVMDKSIIIKGVNNVKNICDTFEEEYFIIDDVQNDEESIMDDQILKWISQLLESLNAKSGNQINLRSQASKLGLGQETTKPQRKTVFMDFSSNKNNDENDKQIEEYAIKQFKEFSKEFLNIGVSINNSNDEFEINSTDFIKMILTQFENSSGFELDLKLLNIVFYVVNRKSEFIKQIQKTLFLVSEQKVITFQALEQMVKYMRFTQERSQIWLLGTTKLQQEMAAAYLQQLKEIFNFMTSEEICQELIDNSNLQKQRIINVIERILNLDYIFQLLLEKDFYEHQNEQNLMFTIFKCELLELIGTVWFTKQKTSQETEKNQNVKNFVIKTIKQIQSMTKEKLTDTKKILRNLRKGVRINQGQQHPKDDFDVYKNLENFLQEFAPNKKIEFINSNFKTQQLDQFEFSIYLLGSILPFMFHLKKHLILRIQSKGIFEDCNQVLEQEQWGILDEFADVFIDYFQNKLGPDQQVIYYKFFYIQIQDFKMIFGKEKPVLSENLKPLVDQIQISNVYKMSSQDHIDINSFSYSDFDKIKNKGFGQSLPNLRNQLCLKKGNYQREAFRNILLQNLTNSRIRDEIVIHESDFFLEMLNQHLDNLQLNQFETHEILDKIIQFLEVGIKHLQSDSNVRQVMYNCFQLLASFIESFKQSSKKLKDIQNYLFDSCFGRIIMGAFGNPQSYFDEQLIGQILRIVIALLLNNNQSIQKTFEQLFTQDSKIENLVGFIDNVIYEEQLKIQQMSSNINKKRFIMLNSISYNYDKSDRHVINHCYNFIQSLCQNHFKPFQHFWKNQPHCNNSYDILDSLIKLLDAIVETQFQSDTNLINMNAYQKEMLMESLETILSLIQGKCQENKNKVLQSTLIKNFKYFISVDEFTEIDTTQLSQQQDELFEYGINLKMFYEGYMNQQELINLKNQCFEITEHLIENDKDSIIRKKIVRNLTFKRLYRNLIRIYQVFKRQYDCKYNMKNENALGYGFQIFLLIRELDDTNKYLQEYKNMKLQSNKKRQSIKNEEMANKKYYKKEKTGLLQQIKTLLNFKQIKSKKGLKPQHQKKTDDAGHHVSLKQPRHKKKRSEIDNQILNYQEIIQTTEQGFSSKISQEQKKKSNIKIQQNYLQQFPLHDKINESITDDESDDYYDNEDDEQLLIELNSFKSVPRAKVKSNGLQTMDFVNKTYDLEIFIEAYKFFSKNTASIEIVNENNEMQDVYFAYLPHFNALNDDIRMDFSDLIQRDNMSTKYASIMEISRQFNQKLLSEQIFIDMASVSQLTQTIIVLSKKQPQLRFFNFVLSLIGNINLLIVYAPGEDFQFLDKEEKLNRDPIMIDDILFQVLLWVQNVVVSVLFLFYVIQNKSYISWLIKYEIKSLEEKEVVDLSQVGILQDLNKKKKKVGFFTKKYIWCKYWFNNQNVLYFVTFTPILLLANFWHELFGTLLLLDFLFRFPETQNVFKAFWKPRYKLITNLCLYVLIMYYFSLLAFLYLARDYYVGTCENLLMCFSVIFDNAQKQRISKLYALLNMYQDTLPAYLMDREDFFDFGFMLIVVSCVWTWTFTSLIIESYGALRRAAVHKQNDMQNICLPCNLSREKIQKVSSVGFDNHVKLEHNQWNYLRYMASLWYKPKDQFTGTEKYIFENIKKKKIHWFPIEKNILLINFLQ